MCHFFCKISRKSCKRDKDTELPVCRGLQASARDEDARRHSERRQGQGLADERAERDAAVDRAVEEQQHDDHRVEAVQRAIVPNEHLARSITE